MEYKYPSTPPIAREQNNKQVVHTSNPLLKTQGGHHSVQPELNTFETLSSTNNAAVKLGGTEGNVKESYGLCRLLHKACPAHW